MSDALVSVVIPCFNQGHFLHAAIESALAQCGVATELIVVDDGSTDDTATVAARYPEVQLIRQSNMGLAAARNSGLNASRGDYLAFLDADDRFMPDGLHAGLQCLAQHPDCAFAWGRYIIRSDSDDAWEPSGDVEQRSDAYAALLRGNHIAMHAAVLYRREALKQVGGFDARLPACEDYELYLRVARRFPIARHKAIVAEYRKHGKNMSVDGPMMLAAVLRVMEQQRDYVDKNDSYQTAHAEGLRFWKQFYGVRSIGKIARDLSALRFGEARHDAARLFRSVSATTVLLNAPAWFVRHWAANQSRREFR